MSDKTIGCMVKSRLIPGMIGKLVQIVDDEAAIVVVDGTRLTTCLENWDVYAGGE